MSRVCEPCLKRASQRRGYTRGSYTGEECLEGGAIGWSADEEGVVVAAAEFDELFGFVGGGEKALGMAEVEEFVVAAVEN